MDCACLCPSPPPKILTDDELRPTRKHTARIPVHGCRLVVCSWYVQFINIESFSSRRAIQTIAQPSLYKTRPPILSRTFYRNFLQENNLRTITCIGFDNSTAWLVALRSWNLNCKTPKVAFMNPRPFRCLTVWNQTAQWAKQCLPRPL